MSVESEILRIQHNIANAYAAVSEKGGEVPLQPTSANLAAAVASIPAIPAGGAKGDLLTKSSAVDYDAAWTGLPQIGSELVKPDNPVGAALSGKASNPNLLDNWYFADPINQRGQTEYTNPGYTIDRWITQDLDVKIFDNCIGIKMRANSVSNNFLQVFDNPGRYKGATLTFSMLCKGTANMIVDVNGSFSGTNTGNFGEYNLLHITLEMPENLSRLIVYISCQNPHDGDYAEIFAVKAELGPVQTLAHQDADGNWVLNDPPPNKALELAKCQRYFQTFVTESMRPIHGKDFRPVMRTDNPTLSTITLPDETVLYAASSDL